MVRVAFGIPHTHKQSVLNIKRMRQEVTARFPEFASQIQPYINVLTIKAWNLRGFRVKKGEKSIRVPVIVPVFKEEDGKKVPVGNRIHTAHLFALPQVERK